MNSTNSNSLDSRLSPVANNTTPKGSDTKTAFTPHKPAMKKEIASSFQAVAMCMCLHIFISLIVYERRRRKKGSVKALAKSTVSFARGYMASGKLLRYLCIAGAAFCFLSCLNDLIYYNLNHNTDFGCTVMQIVGISLLIGLDTVVYIFLWIRQYVTCRRFLVRNRPLFFFLTVVKWSVLTLILLLALVMDCLLIHYRRHYFNETTATCEQIPSVADKPITHLWTAGSVTLQIILVFLFAFPLLQQYSTSSQNLNKNGHPPTPKTNNNGHTHSGLPSTNRVRIMALVQRCVVITTLCVATDIATMLVTEYIFTGPYNRQLRALLYNLNIIFNLVLVIRSFKDWKNMVTYGLFKRKGISGQTSHDTNALT